MYLLSCYAGEYPSLADAYKELLSLAHEWKGIGVLLHVDYNILNGIEIDEKNAKNCLHKMLSERMKLTKQLTWDDIVDAIEQYDQRKSEDLHKRIPK